MSEDLTNKWTHRLDRYCAITGALLPVGLVVGNTFELIIGLVGICWIIRCLIARINPLPILVKHKQIMPWLAWYAVVIISLLVNGAGSKGSAHDFALFRQILFLVALLDISQRQPVARFMLTGLISGVILAAVNTMAAHLIDYDLIGRPISEYSGKLSVTGRNAELTMYAAPFFLAWGMLDKELTSKTRWFVMGFGFVAMIMVLQSRIFSAIIASAAGLILTVIIRKRVRPGAVEIFVFLLLLAIGTAIIYPVENFEKFYSLQHRVQIWKVTWAMWLDNPLLGVGVSSFRDAYQEMAATLSLTEFISSDGLISDNSVAYHAHNLPLMILSCTGVLGLATFVWLFINSIRAMATDDLKGWRKGLYTWPLVFLIIGLTGWNIYGSSSQAFLVFFILFIGVKSESDLNR